MGEHLLPRDRLVFPLDVPTLSEAEAWLDRLSAHVGVFKVGLELFTAVGPAAVRSVTDRGLDCFLDLKVHDIPATVAGAVRSAAHLGATYLTVHTASGPDALGAAKDAAAGTATKVLAVTVLTSLDAPGLRSIGISTTPGESVAVRAALALEQGIDGLVCSPAECAALRRSHGKAPLLVVPGIRPTESARDDQRRVATPDQAIADGASLLVVGRPIRHAPDPAAAASRLVDAIAKAAR